MRKEMILCCFMPLLCTLLRPHLGQAGAKQTPGTFRGHSGDIEVRLMMKHAPESVRTSDPVIRSSACYRWTTAPVLYEKRIPFVEIGSDHCLLSSDCPFKTGLVVIMIMMSPHISNNITHREASDFIFKKKWWCFRLLLCTLFRLNWAKQTPGIMRRINDKTCPRVGSN